MWIYDLETLFFPEVNHSAIAHYGYSREEFLNMTLKDIRPVEDITLRKHAEGVIRDPDPEANNSNGYLAVPGGGRPVGLDSGWNAARISLIGYNSNWYSQNRRW